jgi:osmoprotectant transport system ATP-binding protein
MPDHRAATVEFDHVTKRYDRPPGDREALGAVEDLCLAVPAGRICVLVGPSGCGKTTSLKMVNRLVEPTRGRILVDGVDVADRDLVELRRGIGYVIQQVGLFPHQTGRRRERVEELLASVGLDPGAYRDRYPAQLSGGERQRVGVARALAADPPILLMDEPFGAVDPIVRERLQNELLRLQEALAKTILFVTHDIDEAIKMGDLVAVMATGGRLLQYGPPSEILARPASTFVAQLVGADRGLKRLSLARVGELPLRPAITARPGDPAGPARARILDDPFPYLLLVDEKNRPLGWLDQHTLPSEGTLSAGAVIPVSPLFDRRTTLKDALSMLLDADVQAGVLVNRDGALRGIVTVGMIADSFRADTGGDLPGASGASGAGDRSAAAAVRA